MNEELKIPYIMVESMLSRLERTINKLWIVIIILIVLLIGTNIAWIYYESQFVDVITTTTQEVTQDNDGGNNYVVGGDYGKTTR